MLALECMTTSMKTMTSL